jgi:AcrR family transcriptional regulator
MEFPLRHAADTPRELHDRRHRAGAIGRAIVGDVSKGEQTRQAVLEQATVIAARLGLAGLTIGTLASSAGLSKSGLYAHFGSKEELQLATLGHAREVFIDRVLRPALAAPRGEPRLRELFGRWLATGRDLPAGCLYMSSKPEFDDRPGRVRDQLVRDYRDLLDSIGQMVRAGIDEGQLRPDADPAQFAQELDGIVMGFFFAHRLLGDPAIESRAWCAFEAALAGLRTGSEQPTPAGAGRTDRQPVGS